MNNLHNNMKRMLTEEEKKKLKFTTEDHKAVYQKIAQATGEKPKRKFRLQTTATYVVTPVAVATLAFGIMLQTPLKPQVMAAVSYVGSLFTEYGDEGQKEAVKKLEPQKINQTVDNNGVKITIDEILYDGARISVAYSIEGHSEKLKGKNLDPVGMDFKVDGKEPDEYGHRGSIPAQKVGNKYMKVLNMDLGETLPDEFTLDLAIQELLIVDDLFSGNNEEIEYVEGDWKFSFPVKKTGEIYQYTPNVSKPTELGEVQVKEITFAPSGIQLETERKQTEEQLKTEGRIGYKMFDDKGNEMKTIIGPSASYRYKDGIGTEKGSSLFAPVEKIPSSITIKPYSFKAWGDDKTVKHVVNISEQLPIFLPQGKNGGINITKIEQKENETWVHFDVKGDFVKERKNAFSLINGEEKTPENIVEREGDFNNDERENQVIKFKTPYSENLNFISYDSVPEWVKELEKTIIIDEKEIVKLESHK